MADAINIPIKIVDEATGTLAKIQARVQAFQDNLEGIGKASRHVSKVEDALEQVGTTAVKATQKNERLLDSVAGMSAVCDGVRSSIDHMRQSQVQVNGVLAKAPKFVQDIYRDFQIARARIESTEKASDKLLATIKAVTRTSSFKAMRNAVNSVSSALQSQTNVFGKTKAMISSIRGLINRKTADIVRAKQAQMRFNESVESGKTKVNGLLGNVKSLIATYVGVESVKGLVGMSDEASQIGARLDMINDGSQTTAELQNKIFKAAEQSRGSYTDMASSVAKLQLLTGDTFKSNDEAIQFTGNLQKMFAVCGTGAQESSAAMLQLTQALGSGKLQGDEFRSIMEACPMIVQTVADYMGVSVGEMKTLASEGKITSEVMRGALLGATDEINEKFQSMPYTWSQIWTSIKNGFTKIMGPALEKINTVFNENREKISAFANSMSTYISKIVDGLINLGSAFIKLLGNSGVQTVIQTVIYSFTGILRTATMLLTPVGKFLSFLDQIGVLSPLLMTLAYVFTAYAVAVNTATVVTHALKFVLDNVLGIIKIIKTTFTVAGTVIKLICSGISTAIGWISTALYSLAGAIGISIGWLIVIIVAVIAVAVALWYYWDEVKAAGIACWNWIANAASACWSWIQSTWSSVSAWFAGIWNTIKDGAISAWNGVKNAAVSVWQSIWGTVGPLIVAFWNFVSAIFRGGWAIISAIMSGIWNWIVVAWQSIYNFVAPIVSAIWSWIVGKFRAIYQGAVSIFSAVKNWIIGVWQSIYGFVAPIVSRIYSYISEKFNAVRSFCSTIWNAVKTAVVEKVTEIYNKVKEWIDKIVNYFSDLREKMVQKGKDFIQGFIDGVTSMIKSATDTVTKFCDNAVDAINNFFKIGSPSRVMRELGGFVGEGFNLGLEDQIKGAKSAAKGLSVEALGGTYAGAKTTGATVSGGSPNITINVHNTISSEGDVKKLVDQITIMLRDAMHNSAKGVYANV